MTRTQFLILIVTSITLVVVTVANLLVQRSIQQANNLAMQQQAYINNTRQADSTLQQLVIRIAQASDRDPRLRDILAKRGLKATLNIDGQERQFP